MVRKFFVKRLIVIICLGILAVSLLCFVGIYLMYGVSQKDAVAKAFGIENMEGVEVIKYKYKFEKLDKYHAVELIVGDEDFKSILKSIPEIGTNFTFGEFELISEGVADLRWYDINSAAEIYKYRYKPEYDYIYPFYDIRQYNNIFAPQKHTAYAVMYVSESTNGQRHIYLEAFA